MDTNQSSQPARQVFLDWLRIGAFALLVPYHVGMYYVSWDWHVKSPELQPGLEPWMMLASPWRLGLLFLVAGAASAHLWRRGGAFVRTRSSRLLWPLLFGMLVVVPPQAYVQVVTQGGYQGGYVEFMRLYLSGYDGFCRAGECLLLPTWNHLWFLAYLWLYTMLGWALTRARPDAAEIFAAWLARHGTRTTLLLTLALPLIAARMLVARFPSTHALLDDAYNHAQYLPLFLLGWVGAHSTLWNLAARHRRLALSLAALSWCAVMAYFQAYAEQPPPEALRWAQRVVYGAMQWWCLVAVCGYARHWLTRDHAWRAPLNRSVYALYVLHQTVIVLLAWSLQPLGWSAWIEAPTLIVLTFAACAATYLLARHVPVLRGALGIAPVHGSARAGESESPHRRVPTQDPAARTGDSGRAR